MKIKRYKSKSKIQQKKEQQELICWWNRIADQPAPSWRTDIQWRNLEYSWRKLNTKKKS